MPQGLQIWDAAGNLVFDTTLRTLTIFGNINVSSAGSLVEPDFSKGEPFWLFYNNPYNAASAVDISISGNTLSWAAGSDGLAPSGNLIYGVR